jgi:DNA repair protein RecO (recombination protein O)
LFPTDVANMSERSRLYRSHAVVLRRRDYNDADRILTVFTPNYGKLELIAKGVRKTTSRKAGHLELFAHTSLLVAQARTWDIITEAVTVESFTALRSDLERISQAAYLCELVDCLTEAEDENQPLWDLLVAALTELNAISNVADAGTSSDPGLLLRWCELHLLSLAGFQPQFFECLQCGRDLEPVANYIGLTEGGVFCPDCGSSRSSLEPLDADTLKVLRFLQSRPWSVARQVSVRPHVLHRVENLLYRYLLVVLERQLKSVDFLRRLQAAPRLPAAATG